MPDVKEIVRIGEQEAIAVLSTHSLTRYLCDPAPLAEQDRKVSRHGMRHRPGTTRRRGPRRTSRATTVRSGT